MRFGLLALIVCARYVESVSTRLNHVGPRVRLSRNAIRLRDTRPDLVRTRAYLRVNVTSCIWRLRFPGNIRQQHGCIRNGARRTGPKTVKPSAWPLVSPIPIGYTAQSRVKGTPLQSQAPISGTLSPPPFGVHVMVSATAKRIRFLYGACPSPASCGFGAS